VVWEVAQARDRANGVPLPPAPVQAFLRRRFLANDACSLRAKAAILLEEPDRVAALAAVLAAEAMPAAVVTGADDDVWSPAEQEQMAARLDRPWIEVPGAGHFAVDAPAATVAALMGVLEHGLRTRGLPEPGRAEG
jgi:pimeloyl-ACP methyl ester carboxylesterase